MNAVASRCHSDATWLRPLSRKRLALCHSLSRPKTGSTIVLRRRYSCLAGTVAINCLCRCSIGSCSLIFMVRPLWEEVHVPKAGQALQSRPLAR